MGVFEPQLFRFRTLDPLLVFVGRGREAKTSRRKPLMPVVPEHRIVVVHLTLMMDKQYSDPVLVRQLLENTDVPVVTGVWISVSGNLSYSLERVDDYQHRVRIRFQEILDLISASSPSTTTWTASTATTTSH
jgi:hypothetical protein